MIFYFALFMGAACFTVFGWMLHASITRQPDPRPGYLPIADMTATAEPRVYDWEAAIALQRYADALDAAHGDGGKS